ncbi:putative glucan-binding protein D [Streptococcus varani]|uniref:Putative glucan-binding protein D n=1 Tax=Streptococcus varani TaxID=1608583 RepID=A0A0E4H4C1_9STRE|nr:alpha/beta hydrolase [Streptococcus varani]CQR24167.1 putative glucan-binding protein D [Streptococcus varani]
MKKYLLFGASLCLLSTLAACQSNSATKNVDLSGTYTAYLQGDDWGESISKITLKLDKEVDAKTISADDFKITEKREIFDWKQPEKGLIPTDFDRTVLDAYVSDEDGKKEDKNSTYVTLEMAVGPNDGRYFVAGPGSPSSQYPELYELGISLSDKSDVTSDGSKVEKLTIDSKMTGLSHSAENFKIADFKSTDGVDYKYASFEPEEKSDILVVWLHGLMEGGKENTDPYITLLGNEAANLGKKEFQETMGGAHVLVPQSPSFWMDKTGSDQLVEGKIISDGTSFYSKSLHELITDYKEKVGAKKVIIAGASNGGYMGMVLAREYGKEYDGYMLLCEAMEDRFVTDEAIQKLKDLPLYFVYSKDDPLVLPEVNEIPTVNRLKAAGAADLQVAVFDHVQDTSGRLKDDKGQPYDFGGHSVWVPFFNNEVKSETGVSAWEWMAEQVK